jgi:hypothetical protein
VNTEERQLSDLLHRLTPEPPRRVTIEEVAIRMANQAGQNGGGHRVPRPRGASRFGGRGLVPALAALAVVVVAGLSAGIAVLASSHSNPPPQSVGGPTSTSAPASVTSSTPSTTVSASTGQGMQREAIADGPWSAALIDHQTLTQDSLISADGSLYAIAPGSLARIDPASGVVTEVPVDGSALGPPVVSGHTVWVASYHPGGVIDLQGFDASTLAKVQSWTVDAIGALSSSPEGVLAAGPDGTLYVAAGVTVVAVDPSNGSVVNRFFMNSGVANSVAVSPNGKTLYAGTRSYLVVAFDVAGGEVTGRSTLDLGGNGGNLVATSGGLWGTVGVGMSESTWFAPHGDLSRAVKVGGGGGGGLASVPSLSGGTIWIGGGQTLICADPSTGQVLASATLPTDHGATEYFGSAAVVGGRAFAYYQDQGSQRSGVVQITPPASCAG